MKSYKPKKTMQNVSFKNIDDFFSFLNEDELAIVALLRDLVYEVIPDCKEKLSFNVPFFSKRYSLCFIWPASITWGGVKQKGAVRFGLTKGSLIKGATDYLNIEDRKLVCWRDFSSIEEIDVEIITRLLKQAAILDEELFLFKRKKKSK